MTGNGSVGEEEGYGKEREGDRKLDMNFKHFFFTLGISA